MNSLLKRMILCVFSFFCMIQHEMQANVFLDAARVQVDKITDKKATHRSPLEFKQAVIRYIKHTDFNCFQHVQRSSDENIAYKKELRYLFKNYGSFSAITLLSRLCSAHQAMVQHDNNPDGDTYQHYEQICSALLLTCCQVFSHEMRNHILHALHDIDNLLVYWNYQHNHQLYYFFHKSPTKWIMGKGQEKEIAHNIVKLERKQKELYMLLGSLTEHLHSFAGTEIAYQDCYTWIERLFEIIPDGKAPSKIDADGSRFDAIAKALEPKLKRMNRFKSDVLSSVVMARKPNRFVRNWIAYTSLLATIAYMAHYNAKHPETIPSAAKAVQDEAGKFFMLLLHPIQKIYERGKQAFSTGEKGDEAKKEVSIDKKVETIDREEQLLKLIEEIVKVGKETESSISEQLAKSVASVREDGLRHLRDAIQRMQDPNYIDGFRSKTEFKYDFVSIESAVSRVENVVEPIKENDFIINQENVDQYKKDLSCIYEFIGSSLDKVYNFTDSGRKLSAKLVLGLVCLRADDEYLSPLQKYTEIIDKKILRIFQISADVVENIGLQAKDLIAETKQLEKDAAEELKYIKKQLKDHELTLMFTSLIPLGITALIGSKTYQWIITRDYSSIRIALADVNSLLIEAAHDLDDYNYGKLVYLIYKLRHKSMYLKDPLTNEFLEDVAKLESKQHSPEAKHGIVENMFNKYAFLGKIAI